MSVFSDMSFEDERNHILGIADWVQRKASQGYHAVDWPVEYGGLGLSRAHARALGRVERQFDSPGTHELVSVTVGLIATTIRALGSDALKARFIPSLRSAEILACQLFSEPGAGSDLAGLSTRAERDGDEWVINGQKVWSSGAQFSQWGELIARTDPDVAKHKGLTAFMLPLDAPGVEVRPIKQMSGGSSFCEVFFTDVRIPDDLRLGEVGDGWNVATTTLSFERDHSESGSEGSASGGSWKQLLATARQMGVVDEPVLRDKLMQVYIHGRVESYTNRRAADLARSGMPGPEGSLGKLLWTAGMTGISEVIGDILGAAAHCRHGGVGHLRVERAPARCARLPHRWRQRRGAAQHHRRTSPRPAPRTPRRHRPLDLHPPLTRTPVPARGVDSRRLGLFDEVCLAGAGRRQRVGRRVYE